MHIHHLALQDSVLHHFLGQIREVGVQNDSMRFRRNIERIGEIMSYEISKELAYNVRQVPTPLGTKEVSQIAGSIVICSVLRAGLPLHLGFLNYFDDAENGFISAFRHHPNHDDYFEIIVQYQAIPEVTGKTVLLVDPMLATGQSLVAVYNRLMERGNPSEIHVAVVIAAPEGIEHLQKNLPDNCHLWVASIDEKLNERQYIVPGLGDAGDLAYGVKL